MDAASLLAGHPVAAASDASSAAAARDARLDPKLVAAAHSFEASLMQELLKPLDRGGGADGEFGEDGSDDALGSAGEGLGETAAGSETALVGFGSEALASALAQKGGLGIARRILDHFEALGASAARETALGPRVASTAEAAHGAPKPRFPNPRRN